MGKGSKIRGFEDLEVWQLGKNLVVKVYELTKSFPKEERFCLVDQIRRAAISIPANIAESFGRYHYMDRVKFLLHARGSLNELKSHLLIARELGFIGHRDLDSLVGEIENLSVELNNLITITRSQR